MRRWTSLPGGTERAPLGARDPRAQWTQSAAKPPKARRPGRRANSRGRGAFVYPAAFFLVVVLAAVPAFAAFPADPPNDPSYPGQQYLFSTIPPSTPNATDPEGAAGMSVDRAWRDFTTGRPDTVIAYIEGGINWHAGDAAELANKVFINRRELPPPCAVVPCSSGPQPRGVRREPRRRDQRGRLRDRHARADANGNGRSTPRTSSSRFSDGTTTTATATSTTSPAGTSTTPERPGDGGLRVRPRQRPDEAGGGADRTTAIGGAGHLPALPRAADQGGRRGARPHRRPRPGVAVRGRHRARR